MKTLAEQCPELRLEWDSEKNAHLSFDKIAASSKKRASWRCPKDARHFWLAQIRDRSMGHGCPYCSGRYILREESFGALFPELLKQLHPSRNDGFDPFATAPFSNKRVVWVCSDNSQHFWETRLSGRTDSDAGCPHCRKQKSSLAEVAPRLADEWHPTQNLPHTPQTVSAGSRIKAWWVCLEDSTHVWHAQVRMRVDAKTGCPICSKKKGPQKQPSIVEFSQKLASEWHPTRNGLLQPHEVTVGTHRSIWWKCPNGPDHEWQASVRNRARLGHGCPMCSPRTGRVSKGTSLADKYPAVAAQWDHELNGSSKPEHFTPGSTRSFHWKCNDDPPHRWESTIYNRVSNQPDGNCPFCSKSRLTTENTLGRVHPVVAAEWHPGKNGNQTPESVSRASGRKVWWLCSKDSAHEWEATIKNRTVHKSGCPHCEATQKSERLRLAILESVQLHDDCLKTLRHNLKTLNSLVRKLTIKSVHLNQAFFRMAYSSAITALESYLSDTFYQLVITDQARLEKLLSTAPEFAERKYSLSEVVDWSQNLSKKVGEYLFDLVWHNLAKIKKMYSTVLGVQFPQDISPIMRAIAIRHDIVHRNGRTKDKGLHTFKPDDLNKLFILVENFATHIEDQLVACKDNPT